MRKVALYLIALPSLIAGTLSCSTHNPFATADNNSRIDGTFVNFKATGLPGSYSAEAGGDETAFLDLDSDGKLEVLFPLSSIEGCQLHLTGELATLRKIPPAEPGSSTKEFRFGAFKGSFDTDSTHMMVVYTDLIADAEPVQLAVETLFQGEVVRTFLMNKEADEEAALELSSLLKTAEGTEAEENPRRDCATWDISNNYDYRRRLFLQPIEWAGDTVILDGVVLQKK